MLLVFGYPGTQVTTALSWAIFGKIVSSLLACEIIVDPVLASA